MKKIFTFSMAAAAVLSVSAAQPFAPVKLAATVGFEAKKVGTGLPEKETVASRADEAINLAGDNYITAAYMRYPNPTGGNPYEMLRPSDDITIVADPEVENGYIINNMFYSLFYDKDELPGTINGIKAVYDPAEEKLTIPAGQVLTHYTYSDGTEDDLNLMAVSGGEYRPDLPIVLDFKYGTLEQATQGIAFLTPTNDPEYPFRGADFVAFDYIAYQPNGEMTYYDMAKQQEASSPILGVNVNGRNFIFNFANVDRFHSVPFVRKNNNTVKYDGTSPVAQVIINHPQVNPETINELFYLTEINNDNDPAFADGFFITGEIVTNEPDECVIELPACGLFTQEDKVWGCYDEVVISYNPDAIVAIETIAPDADNANAPVVYYNLQGMRVDNPQGGIFIRQQGTESTKVLVK